MSGSFSRGVTSLPQKIALTLGVVALGGVALFGGVRVANGMNLVNDTTHILPGVQIAGIPVGGCTRDEATEKIRAWARERSGQKVSLYAPVSGRAWNLTLADAGGLFDTSTAVEKALAIGRQDNLWSHLVKGGEPRTEDVTVPFRFNEGKLEKQLERIAKAIYKAPKNATAKMSSEGQISVAAREVKGVGLDIPATKSVLLKGGVDSLRDGGEADLVIRETLPSVLAADIERMTVRLGTFTTDYSSSSSNRRHNVEKATGFINGVVLAAGELFSYNEVVGPREPELGWLNAPTIQDGQLVPGPGGGVCQVSTTLFNAVRRADMKIVARTGHSKPVHYAPPGMDATVAYGQIDFKFRNSHRNPVLIMGRANNGTLTFAVYGPSAQTAKKESDARSEKQSTAKSGDTTTVASTM